MDGHPSQESCDTAAHLVEQSTVVENVTMDCLLQTVEEFEVAQQLVIIEQLAQENTYL